MAERKVLIKYFPKNFDHQRIVKRGRGKDKLMMVRNMLPMSLRCNTCQNYLYMGTKFNMRMEICNQEVYLGIKVFRFYFKCTYCYAEITFKTDPKNHDYLVQNGGTRNYEAIKDAQHAEKYMKRLKANEKEENSMQYLQNKSYDSKREMELMEALEDIKNLNKRQGIIDPEDLLKNLIYEEEEENQFNSGEDEEIDQKINQLKQQMQSGQQTRIFGEGTIPVQPKEEEKDSQLYQKNEENKDDQVGVKREAQTPIVEQVPLKRFLPNLKLGQQKKVQVKSVISGLKKKIIKPISKQQKN